MIRMVIDEKDGDGGHDDDNDDDDDDDDDGVDFGIGELCNVYYDHIIHTKIER